MRRRCTAFGLAILTGCAAPPSPVPEPTAPPRSEEVPLATPPLVRVAVLVQVPELQIGATEHFTLGDEDGTLVVGSTSEVFHVRREGDRLLLQTPGGELMDSAEGFLRLATQNAEGLVTVNGARYPGGLEITPAEGGGLWVVNVVDVETYLRGVVPLEIGIKSRTYLEAAKAQAIAARTYVAGHLNQYARLPFDLYAGVRDQVYGPVDRREPDADLAIRETRGMILVHDGKPIRANYASTCGGRTAGVEESFPVGPLPYLQSREDRLGEEIACRNSRVFRWSETWTGEELTRALARTIPKVLRVPWKGTAVRGVEAVETGRSGRIMKLRIVSDQQSYLVERGAIREVLENPAGKPLRSTDFHLELVKRDGRIQRMSVEGRGWGHGVGMCQWGAMQLSQEGVEYARILRHYYAGAELRPWYPSRPPDGTAGRGGPAHD